MEQRRIDAERGKTEVIGRKEKLESVPLCPPQMTKASRDLICHTSEDGRHCISRKGTGICGGGCGDCQPNCQHSRTIVNERTPCTHQLCLRTCLMLNTLYTSVVPQNMSHVEHLYTSAVPQNMSHVEHPVYISCASEHLMLNTLYTSVVPQNMSHVEHPVYISCGSEHASC